MVTLKEAQQDYTNRWALNAKQHFIDGDYDWVSNLIGHVDVNRVLEVGCGTGYSTLSLANKGIKVCSIDPIGEAIDKTNRLLEEFNVRSTVISKVEDIEDDFNSYDVILIQSDIIENYDVISALADFVELVLICNPGGKIEPELTQNEKDILHWGLYSDEQMKEETIQSLHRWAVLLASAKCAIDQKISLIIVDRGTDPELDEELNCISDVTGLIGVKCAIRPINKAPEGGISMSSQNENIIWKAGLFKSVHDEF